MRGLPAPRTRQCRCTWDSNHGGPLSQQTPSLSFPSNTKNSGHTLCVPRAPPSFRRHLEDSLTQHAAVGVSTLHGRANRTVSSREGARGVREGQAHAPSQVGVGSRLRA